MRSIIFFLIIVICFCSCDGRYKLKDSKAEAVKAFILKTQNEPVIKYIPEHHAEVVTDTLINNKTQVKITSKLNNYSLVALPSKTSQTNTTLAYKSAQTEVLIQQKDQVVFSKIIDKSLFVNTDSFWEYAVLESVWVNQELSLDTFIVLDVVYRNPELQFEKLYYLKVDKNGNYIIEVA